MPTVTAWFTTAFALSTTAGGRFSNRRPATNSPSWTASGREAVDIAVSTIQHLARAEHLSDVEPLRAYRDAAHQAAGVDEAHVLEEPAGRRDAGGDRAERRDRRDGLRHAAQTEGARPGPRRGGQGLEHAPHGEAGEHRVVHHGERGAVGQGVDPGELSDQLGRLGADQVIAAAAVFLAR